MTGARRTASGARRKGPILLLVLRDEAIRTRFAQALVADGYLVLEAEDWSAGLAKALTLAPDVIALEVSVLASGGADAARLLKTHDRTSHIPILALCDRSWRAAALRAAGFDQVLNRPCSQSELLDAVHRLVASGARRAHGGTGS